MKKLKKCAALLMVSVLTAVLWGCGEKLPKGPPVYAGDETMFLGAFWCPEPTEEKYREVAACGINHMIVNDREDAPVGTPKFYEIPFDLGDKFGVKILPYAHNQPYTYYFRPEFLRRESFAGMNVYDEPSADDFADLAKSYETYRTQVPGFPYYVNLFPMYGTSKDFGTKTYEEYVSRFTDEVLMIQDPGQRVMICDIYPLLKHSQLYAGWLRNLEILQENARRAGAKLYIYLQDISFSNRRQPAGASDIRFQAYVNMAYGASGFYHFTYQTPTADAAYPAQSHGIVDREGNKTEVYDYVKEVNEELLAFDHVFLSFQWKETMALIGSENLLGENVNFANLKDPGKASGTLKSASGSQDTLVGRFEDGSGYEGFLAVNFTDPTLSLGDEIELEFKGASRALVYIRGAAQTVALEGGRYRATLEPGEGRFIIPFGE